METISSELQHLIEMYSYLGILLWFVFFDRLTPIPEEFSLLIIGYVCSHTSLNPLISSLSAMMGMFIIDLTNYFFIRKGSRFATKLVKRLDNKYFQRLFKGRKENLVRNLFIMLLIPKIRVLTPIYAGVSKVEWKKFLYVDTLGTLLVAFVWVFTGVFFHNSLKAVFKELELFQHFSFILILVLMALIGYFFLNTKNR